MRNLLNFIRKNFFRIFAFITLAYVILNSILHKRIQQEINEENDLDNSALSPFDRFLENNQNGFVPVRIESSPGNGNQANTFFLMQRLRDYGYDGGFEVVYAPDSKHYTNVGGQFEKNPDENKKKIINLMGLPQNITDEYYDRATNTLYVTSDKHYKAAQTKKLKLNLFGISGGQGLFCDDLVNNGWRYNETSNTACGNNANALNVIVYLSIPSWQHMSIQLEIYNETYKKIDIHGAAYYFNPPISTLETAEKFLLENRMGKQLLKQKPALQTYIDIIKQQSMYILPCYGYHLRLPPKPNNYNSENSYPTSILNIVTGAYLSKPLLSQLKPILIPVFYPYENELNTLNQLLNKTTSWGIFENPLSKEIREVIAKTNLTSHLSFIHLGNKNATQQLQLLTPNQVALINMGEFPQNVFNGLYFGAANQTLIYHFEGETTRNAVIYATPKPYIRREFMFNRNSFAFPFQSNFTTRVNHIKEFIVQGQNPNSSISKYFFEQHQKALIPKNNRIKVGLKEVAKQLYAEKVPISSKFFKFFKKIEQEMDEENLSYVKNLYN